MIGARRSALAIALVLPLLGQLGGPAAATDTGGCAIEPRREITASELTIPAFDAAGPVHNDCFAPPPHAAPARHAFSGTLALPGAELAYATPGGDRGSWALPGVEIAFFTHGDHLLPVTRDFVELSDRGRQARLLISPGRVWSEPGDEGLSRAAFPFLLTYRFYNGARNGLATFLFDDERVSAVRFQITQETAAGSQYDMWGQAAADYRPAPIAGRENLASAFVEEYRQRWPLRPWSDLEALHPSADLTGFDGDLSPEEVSASGLVVDGVVYLKACNTRTGPFPYCASMRHSVYSVTKSMAAALALFTLAERYGDEIFNYRIEDYVAVTADHDGWSEVTFADALNMATGIGDENPERYSRQTAPDENGEKMSRWNRAPSASEKLDASFTYGDYPWGPGEVFRYNSTHTYILAAAMDALVKSREGPETRLWEFVGREVLRPLGILHAPLRHTKEPDGGPGLPEMAVGLYPTIDMAAKIASLFQASGRHEGRQLLSRDKLDEALYRTPARGLRTGGHRKLFDVSTYHLSFWYEPFRIEEGCMVRIPSMSGYGGNLVVMMPNGLTAFRFSDSGDHDIGGMVGVANAIRPFCP